ncbi:MAG: CDGSH iron-sulfur domain-containing protein [Streptomyces sp.]|nr:CDGSH iron-sulfur domain-containing protein [Streptomyces sp.]
MPDEGSATAAGAGVPLDVTDGPWPATTAALIRLAAAARPPRPEDAPEDAGSDHAPADSVERLWAQVEVAAAARHGGEPGVPALVPAALQAAARLWLRDGGDTGPDRDRLAARLDALPGNGRPRVSLAPGGPLVVEGRPAIVDHLGRPLELGDPTVLCRCGGSAVKPLCDAACARDGFDDGKDPDRVPDRRDTYPGVQVTVLDNRGICQHSGRCTDRLPGVFHAGGEPFVTPSGGRMDEIVRAVRDCPSGALGYAVDGIEAREQADWGGTRAPSIEVTQDGPYRLVGGVEVVSAEGAAVPRAEGASPEHCALCRCGHSQNKPFCSGMHWYVEFRDPVADPDHVPSVFEWAGGLPALLRMTRIFYERHVPADDLLGPLFASMSPDHPQRVAAWLAEVFGGPAVYSDGYGGYHRMLSMHVGRRLTEQQRARWVELLTRSAGDAGLPNDAEFRSAFGSYLEWGTRLAFENSQTDARPPQNMPMPRWDWHTSAGPPGSRVSALPADAAASPPDPAPDLPAEGEPLRFDPHVRSLFRAGDRRSMSFAFDLWSHDDVRAHAPAILERLRNGSMPCDGAWPAERIGLFARWIEEGAQ